MKFYGIRTSVQCRIESSSQPRSTPPVAFIVELTSRSLVNQPVTTLSLLADYWLIKLGDSRIGNLVTNHLVTTNRSTSPLTSCLHPKLHRLKLR